MAIRKVVQQAGPSLDRILKCSVFMADFSAWGAMNEVYTTYFDVPPARRAFGTSGLAPGVRLEIDCIAVAN
jgi:2-iminobutanoate/2-iminopropanoate deaminase